MSAVNSNITAGTHLRRQLFVGSIVTPISLLQLRYIKTGVLGVDADGVIRFLAEVDGDDVEQAWRALLFKHGWKEGEYELVQLQKGEFLCPGLIDTHTHACQIPNIGLGQQYELLDWLQNVTFPREKRFADTAYARRTYASVVQRLIDSGTTTACYYATLHLEASKILAQLCHEKGQRAFVGKCQMDRNSPEEYREESAEQSLEDTREFIGYCGQLAESSTSAGEKRKLVNGNASESDLEQAIVQPILTPRFAISCTDALLKGISNLHSTSSHSHPLRIQTHLSENPSEILFTKQLFPFADNYTAVYDHFSLLTPRTVLAHCVHLEQEEIDLIKARGCGVSHCPTSNINLRSGNCPVGELLNQGVKVGLGTDVSGGYGISILSAIRETSVVAKVVNFANRDIQSLNVVGKSSGTAGKQHEHDYTRGPLPIATLFYLATLGGAQVCAMEDRIGSLEPGKEFDALLIRTESEWTEERGYSGNPGLFADPDDTLEELVERFMFTGDDRSIARVYVRGRRIDSGAQSN